jgi:hypothetical protein
MAANLSPAARTRLAEERFRSTLTAGGYTPAYSEWRGIKAPHAVTCAAGHECAPHPNAVMKGQGICRACVSGWDAFYVVRNPETDVVKLGVTSGDPRPRLANHARDGYTEVVRSWRDLPGTTAGELEAESLKLLRLAGIRPVRGREYFPGAVLGMVLHVADAWLG